MIVVLLSFNDPRGRLRGVADKREFLLFGIIERAAPVSSGGERAGISLISLIRLTHFLERASGLLSL
jgi:hypothetical protein